MPLRPPPVAASPAALSREPPFATGGTVGTARRGAVALTNRLVLRPSAPRAPSARWDDRSTVGGPPEGGGRRITGLFPDALGMEGTYWSMPEFPGGATIFGAAGAVAGNTIATAKPAASPRSDPMPSRTLRSPES
jgi:hypothetical protein